MDRLVQTIGTTDETIVPVDITAAGYAYFKNLDPTNYVELGPATTVYMIKLKAGQACVLPLKTGTVYAKANTAAVKVQWMLLGE